MENRFVRHCLFCQCLGLVNLRFLSSMDPKGDHEMVGSIILDNILNVKLLASQPCPNPEHGGRPPWEWVFPLQFWYMSSQMGVLCTSSNCHFESLQSSCQVTHSWLSEFNFLSLQWLAGVLCGCREQLQPRWQHLAVNRLLLISPFH
jgi:hypothetical protein